MSITARVRSNGNLYWNLAAVPINGFSEKVSLTAKKTILKVLLVAWETKKSGIINRGGSRGRVQGVRPPPPPPPPHSDDLRFYNTTGFLPPPPQKKKKLCDLLVFK